MKARHCKYMQKIKCGVPQGDPLSMELFCLGTDCILRFLESEKIPFIGYADDVTLGIGKGDEKYQVTLDLMKKKYREIGLILNVEKSSSTLNKGTIEFMG